MPSTIYECMCAKLLQSCPAIFDPRAIACKAPLSKGLSWQEYWSGSPCPPPGDPPNPGIRTLSLLSPALASGFFTTSAT